VVRKRGFLLEITSCREQNAVVGGAIYDVPQLAVRVVCDTRTDCSREGRKESAVRLPSMFAIQSWIPFVDSATSEQSNRVCSHEENGPSSSVCGCGSFTTFDSITGTDVGDW
jgi:hypothetical protein